MGYGRTNGSTRFGCTVYVITAQPEVWVWLDALYVSGLLYEQRGLHVVVFQMTLEI